MSLYLSSYLFLSTAFNVISEHHTQTHRRISDDELDVDTRIEGFRQSLLEVEQRFLSSDGSEARVFARTLGTFSEVARDVVGRDAIDSDVALYIKARLDFVVGLHNI